MPAKRQLDELGRALAMAKDRLGELVRGAERLFNSLRDLEDDLQAVDEAADRLGEELEE